MKTYRILILTIILLSLISMAIAQETIPAVDSNDVRAISQAVVNHLQPDKLLSWAKYETFVINGIEYSAGYQAVMVIDDFRYTTYVSNDTGLPDSTNLDYIAIWKRPEGTILKKDLEFWTDYCFDGQVNSFKSMDDSNRDYYQKLHNQAIIELKKFYYNQ